MEKFTYIKSKVAPLAMNDVDTDLIIPAQYLTSISRKGYGENLFRRLRDEREDFVLNQSKFSGAQILIAGDNFGCGSSREHAVWAILGYGFKVVIAESFADIFAGNSAKNGLLLIALGAQQVARIQKEAAAGDYLLEIDLEAQEVTEPDGKKTKFTYDPFRKHCLLNGLDDLDYIISHREEVDKYRKSEEGNRFFKV